MQTTAVGAKKITIDAWNGQKFHVTPTTHVLRGEQLLFENVSGGDVKIQISSSGVLSADELSIAADQSEVVTVNEVAAPGTYPFAVFCFARTRFGRGNSMPIIIVDKT